MGVPAFGKGQTRLKLIIKVLLAQNLTVLTIIPYHQFLKRLRNRPGLIFLYPFLPKKANFGDPKFST